MIANGTKRCAKARARRALFATKTLKPFSRSRNRCGRGGSRANCGRIEDRRDKKREGAAFAGVGLLERVANDFLFIPGNANTGVRHGDGRVAGGRKKPASPPARGLIFSQNSFD
jgi:hypothetical protein